MRNKEHLKKLFFIILIAILPHFVFAKTESVSFTITLTIKETPVYIVMPVFNEDNSSYVNIMMHPESKVSQHKRNNNNVVYEIVTMA